MIPQQKKEYATVRRADGVNYREIAEIMTALGYNMNHSSARNHLLRIMRKFYIAYCDAQGFAISEELVDEVCKSASFQEAVSQLIQQLECRKFHCQQIVLNEEPVKTIESGAVRRKVYGSGRRVCVRHRSQLYAPTLETRVVAGSRIVLLPLADDQKIEVHVPGATTVEVWTIRAE